jgi:predicted cupin superfamily sugar epimerase
MKYDTDYWVKYLDLLPHPEGGYYKETFRSLEQIPPAGLPARFNGSRSLYTAIYFLLEQGNFSAFHRIQSDECWHFYAGDALLVHVLHTDGRYECIQLGNQPDKGEQFQAMVPAGAWFASETAPRGVYSLVGCTVAPGFDFADFELADAAGLSAQYPENASLIQRLCR